MKTAVAVTLVIMGALMAVMPLIFLLFSSAQRAYVMAHRGAPMYEDPHRSIWFIWIFTALGMLMVITGARAGRERRH